MLPLTVETPVEGDSLVGRGLFVIVSRRNIEARIAHVVAVRVS